MKASGPIWGGARRDYLLERRGQVRKAVPVKRGNAIMPRERGDFGSQKPIKSLGGGGNVRGKPRNLNSEV